MHSAQIIQDKEGVSTHAHTPHTYLYFIMYDDIHVCIYIYIHADAGQHTEGNTQISQQ